MKTTIIIPARYGSSRFEGKPLYKILGKEMVVRVADICAKVVGIKNLFICDQSVININTSKFITYLSMANSYSLGNIISQYLKK